MSLSNWTQIRFATESPVGSGQFPLTDAQAPNYPARVSTSLSRPDVSHGR